METITPPSSTAWPISGQLLDALSRRDFVTFERCLAGDARLRALLPPGPLDLHGREAITGCFRRWFGGPDDFEMLEASASDIGPKHYLRWRIRMVSVGVPDQPRVVEQHLYTTGTDAIETIDLLCSGFQLENGAGR